MGLQIGIDIGGNSAKIGVVDDDFRIVRHETIRTYLGKPLEETAEELAVIINSISAEYDNEINAVGFGVPSSIEPKHHRIVHANNLGWLNADLLGEFAKYCSIPAYVGNDADCAVIAESLCGSARGMKNVLLITLGTGVGGGLIQDGKLFLGGNGCGFEPGHMIIQKDQGIPCTCGRVGCLDAYGSARWIIHEIEQRQNESAVLQKLIEENDGRIEAKLMFDAVNREDPAAQEIFDYYLHSLAVGISNIITILRPEVVVLGGGVSKAGAQLFDPLRKLVRSMTYGIEVMGCPEIIPAALENEAGIIGAAMLYKM